jgi:hypothetical protein
VARVNGVPLNTPSEWLDEETLRQRACIFCQRRHHFTSASKSA